MSFLDTTCVHLVLGGDATVATPLPLPMCYAVQARAAHVVVLYVAVQVHAH